jgi:hypothetical protein
MGGKHFTIIPSVRLMKRRREQAGTIVQISGRWFLGYYERQNKKGTITRVKVSHPLGKVTTRGSPPPGDITDAAKRHMINVNQSRIRPECTVTLADFVENVHLTFMKENRRRFTHKGYTEIWRFYIKHSIDCRKRLEARVGIEPTHKGFADLSLTTWVPRPLPEQKPSTLSHCTGNCLGGSTSGDVGKVGQRISATSSATLRSSPPIA